MTSPKLLLPLALAVSLAAAAPAGATTICVPAFHEACTDNGTNVAAADLTAASAVDGADGAPDRIVIAPGDLYDADGARFANGTDPLEVVGAGAATRLTQSDQSLGAPVVDLGFTDREVTLRDLTAVVPEGLPVTGIGIWATGDTLENVDVEVRSEDGKGIVAARSSTIRDTRIRAAGPGTLATAIEGLTGSTGTLTIERVVTEGAGVAVYGDLFLVMRRSRIDAGPKTGLSVASGAGGTVANTLITSKNRGVITFASKPGDASVTLDHVTLIGAPGATTALQAAVADGAAGDSVLSARNLIVRGFPVSTVRSAPVGAATGDATIKLAHSAMSLAGNALGDGERELGPGIIADDPLLGADHAPTAGSPAIDHGSPGISSTPFDLAGNPRDVDGDGDGLAQHDMGAFEFQPAPPQDAPPQDTGTPSPASGATTTSPSTTPATGTPATKPSTGDRTAPTIKRLRVARRLNAKRSGAVELTLSEAATVKLTLARAGKRPVTLTFKGKAGRNRLTVRRLPRGTYKLAARAVDAAGNASFAARLKVRVTRR